MDRVEVVEGSSESTSKFKTPPDWGWRGFIAYGIKQRFHRSSGGLSSCEDDSNSRIPAVVDESPAGKGSKAPKEIVSIQQPDKSTKP
jgi:hypothetical protein